MGQFNIEDQKGLASVSTSSYCVDIAMLIDSTGSMRPIIEEVKEQAMSFCSKFHEAMKTSGKNIDELRIKVMPFRDFAYDGEMSLDSSEFFNLPEQNEAFREYVSNIYAAGGGDEPESALEALASAMRSSWTTNGSKRRHVILVFSDASAHALNDSYRTASEFYPANMPTDIGQLDEMWESANQELGGMPEPRSKRLVLFTPNTDPWTSIESWDLVWSAYSKAGQGLAEFDIEAAIQLLVSSIGP